MYLIAYYLDVLEGRHDPWWNQMMYLCQWLPKLQRQSSNCCNIETQSSGPGSSVIQLSNAVLVFCTRFFNQQSSSMTLRCTQYRWMILHQCEWVRCNGRLVVECPGSQTRRQPQFCIRVVRWIRASNKYRVLVSETKIVQHVIFRAGDQYEEQRWLCSSSMRPIIDTKLTYNIFAISARRSGWGIERIMAFCRTAHVGVWPGSARPAAWGPCRDDRAVSSQRISKERKNVFTRKKKVNCHGTIRIITEIRQQSPNNQLVLGLGSCRPSFGEQVVLSSDHFSLNKWREQYEAIKESASVTNHKHNKAHLSALSILQAGSFDLMIQIWFHTFRWRVCPRRT